MQHIIQETGILTTHPIDLCRVLFLSFFLFYNKWLPSNLLARCWRHHIVRLSIELPKRMKCVHAGRRDSACCFGGWRPRGGGGFVGKFHIKVSQCRSWRFYRNLRVIGRKWKVWYRSMKGNGCEEMQCVYQPMEDIPWFSTRARGRYYCFWQAPSSYVIFNTYCGAYCTSGLGIWY